MNWTDSVHIQYVQYKLSTVAGKMSQATLAKRIHMIYIMTNLMPNLRMPHKKKTLANEMTDQLNEFYHINYKCHDLGPKRGSSTWPTSLPIQGHGFCLHEKTFFNPFASASYFPPATRDIRWPRGGPT